MSKIAVLAVTKGGVSLALRLKKNIFCDIYVTEKFLEMADGLLPIKGGLKEQMSEIFQAYQQIIMIMATGIAVRTIAPYVISKSSDPGVVVCNETGEYAVSLLAGHLGGANQLAQEVAEVIGAQAVITTASDSLGKISVDMYAQQNNLVLIDMEMAKKVTAKIVNGVKVGLYQEEGNDFPLPQGIELVENFADLNCIEALIYIGCQKEKSFTNQLPMVQLFPKKLILGIGCRKNYSVEDMQAHVRDYLQEKNIDSNCIKAIASVEIKKNEGAIISLAKQMGVPFQIVSVSDIKEIEADFSSSPLVKKTLGIGAVCEPAAWLVSQKGNKVYGKESYSGMTVALYSERK